MAQARKRSPSLGFLEALSRGEYDHDLGEIQAVLDRRFAVVRAEMLKHVKAVFGQEAEIITRRQRRSQPLSRPNPFISRYQALMRTEGFSEAPEDFRDALSAHEESLNEGVPPSLEQRGAIIAGLSSNDIADS
jgi:hypothetical protein